MAPLSRFLIVFGLLSIGCDSPKQVESQAVVEGGTSNVEPTQVAPGSEDPDPEDPEVPDPEVVPDPISASRLVLPSDASAEEKRFYDGLKKSKIGLVGMSLHVIPGPSDACFAVSIGSHEIGGSGIRTTNCERTLEIAHAATHTRWSNSFGVIDISPFMVAGNGRTIWSPAYRCGSWLSYATSCEEYSQYAGSDMLEFTLQPRSVVGPIVSFTRTWTNQGAGGSGPSHGQDAWTVDIRSGDPATFDALITPESLLDGLKKDPFLQRELGEKLQEAASQEDVWKLWGTDEFYKFGSYYFNEWSSRRGQVAMRIFFLETLDGLSPNELRSLGIWVTPREEFRTVFEAAAEDKGGFMGGRE